MADSLQTMRQRAQTVWDAYWKGPGPRAAINFDTNGWAQGAPAVQRALEQELKRRGIQAPVVRVGGLGLCYLEPLVYLANGSQPFVVYGPVRPEDVPALVESHLAKGQPVREKALGTLGEGSLPGLPSIWEHPFLKPQVRLATRNFGVSDPESLDHYLARGGFAGLERALTMAPKAVIDTVGAAGLRGRGGAAFSTAQKWHFCANAKATPKYVVCNAEEGDSGSFMDRALIESDPFQLMESLVIAGYAMGCAAAYVSIRSLFELALRRARVAVAQMVERGLLGKSILGSSFSFEIIVQESGESYVAGEETALLAELEGDRAQPRARPPFPAQEGLWRRPTNVNNVKTLSYVPAILAQGPEAFTKVGTEKSKGTALVTLSGDVNRTGLVEVPMGYKVRDLVYEVGGGLLAGRQPKVLQMGGPLGGFLPGTMLDNGLDFESLQGTGGTLGSGGIVVAGDRRCVVDLMRCIIGFTQKESCGKCVPCRVGQTQLLEVYNRIASGRARPYELETIQQLCGTMAPGSLCGHGQLTPNPINATIRHFKAEYDAHIHDKQCPTGVCAMRPD
ncbi:MAG: SLBB domain-containing protein [Chloroflexi bacterium]|nr:SLBB domain-containing protein [Chloroflexota bacterium]